jgi:hypothetical protein
VNKVMNILGLIKDGKFLEPIHFSEGLCCKKLGVEYILCATYKVQVNICKIGLHLYQFFFSSYYF